MKKTVLMTGATGNMGQQSLKQMIGDLDKYNLVLLVQNNKREKDILLPYLETPGISVVWGDLTDKKAVRRAVSKADLVLHIAAFVSPQADYQPKKAIEVNFGGTKNLIDAIVEQGRADEVEFVNIGTVAETGDRMPPIHWGRVGDPIKPSMLDYYAVSKVAVERYVIESGLTHWVSLRQTGIIGPAMSAVRDPIMFHNCFDNVLEYVSDRDSGTAMAHLARYDAEGTLDETFWNHIYNIGGGKACRTDTYSMFRILYGELGITKLQYILNPKYQATRNFHGQYYLDSDKLENFLHFRNDGMQYYYDCYLKGLGAALPAAKFITKLPGGQKFMGSILKKAFNKLGRMEHGTIHFIEDHVEDHIDAFWGSKKAWEALPDDIRDMKHFTDWDRVIRLDHGYDETKPEAELELADMKKAAQFRGGKLLSQEMKKGDWAGKLKFQCQFGHEFSASPRLILEGGHWCPECERRSWNYGKRAKGDPFFAQVWDPLHEFDELREYPKEVSDLDVE